MEIFFLTSRERSTKEGPCDDVFFHLFPWEIFINFFVFFACDNNEKMVANCVIIFYVITFVQIELPIKPQNRSVLGMDYHGGLKHSLDCAALHPGYQCAALPNLTKLRTVLLPVTSRPTSFSGTQAP